MADYSVIDSSSLLNYLFYPRRNYSNLPPGAFDLDVTVAPGIIVQCRSYPASKEAPSLLYFHGNGEVVSDYDGIAPLYNRIGLNLLVADYRGYGRSSGKPTFTNLVSDAQKILEAARSELAGRGYSSDLWVMGRSLGSISALELAYSSPESLKGVIFESGFVSVANLIKHLGLPSPGNLEPLELDYMGKVRAINIPALVLHGEADSLVPLSQGQELFDNLGSSDKELVVIPGAEHNDIMFIDPEKYMVAIQQRCIG